MEREKIKQPWLQVFLRGEQGFKQRRNSGACAWGLCHFMTEEHYGGTVSGFTCKDEHRTKKDGALKVGNLS